MESFTAAIFMPTGWLKITVFIPPVSGSTRPVRASSRANTLTQREFFVGLACLVGAGLAAYHNSFAGPFVFDDEPAIADNPSIRSLWPIGGVLRPDLDGGATVSGRPLVNLSLAINHALGGQAVAGYHAVNLLIHLLAGLTLWGIVRRTLTEIPGRSPAAGEALREAAPGLALGVALLWLLHPLQTAAVTYVVQRAESLTGLCYLFTLYAFIRGTEEPARGGRWLVVSAGVCLLGMASKEVMVSAPLIVFLYDRTFVAGSFRAAWRSRWRYYAALALTWVLLAGLVAGTMGRGGTAGFGTVVGPWHYLLTQCEAIVHYLRLAIWPAPLVFDYGTGVIESLGEVWGRALLLTGLAGATLWALWRRPAWGFMGAVFFALLAPSSSFVPVASQTMAEHRMYLPLVIPVVLVVLGLHRLAGRWGLAVCGLLAAACGVLTVARNADYASAGRLWSDTVAKRPDNARAHHNLGLDALNRGNLAEAARHVGDAVALAPRSPEPHYSLGLILAKQGRQPEAIASYEKALAMDPRHAPAHNNLANALLATGRAAEAGRHYAEAVRLEPDFAGARSSYANWLLDEGRAAEALAQCEEAIRLRPTLAEAHYNAGNACMALGRPAEAFARYTEAVRLDPAFAEAHNNLGNLLLERDDVTGAMARYAEAVRLDADYLEPRRNLALLLLHQGRAAEARPHLEILVRLRPDDPEVRAALNRLP